MEEDIQRMAVTCLTHCGNSDHRTAVCLTPLWQSIGEQNAATILLASISRIFELNSSVPNKTTFTSMMALLSGGHHRFSCCKTSSLHLLM